MRMANFADLPIPPRLTPSPPLVADDDTCVDTKPPARRSIYLSKLHPGRWGVTIVHYDPAWPAQFAAIASHLDSLFATSRPQVQYQSIEHIGSTSIPGLCAKPNIDVLVTLPSQTELNNAIEALNWEIPKSPPYTKYTQCPRGGGIQGRESFKIYIPEYSPYYLETPERSVYLINADAGENSAGQIQIRCYRTVRDVLMRQENRDLFDEYARVKWELSRETFDNSLLYSAEKDDIVRKILMRGGWRAEEVDQKENLSRRELSDEEEEPY